MGSLPAASAKKQTNKKQFHRGQTELFLQTFKGVNVFKKADPRGRADAGKLQVEPEEPVELRRHLGFLFHLCDDVLWVGGESQGGFLGAKNKELLLVF